MAETRASSPVKVGLLTMRDARNPRNWSGTPYFISQALQGAGADVSYIGPLDSRLFRALRGIGKLRRRLGFSGTLTNQSRLAAGIMARHIREKVEDMQPDLLFSPAGSALISRLETDLPVVYSSDATLQLVVGYYPEYSHVSARAIAEADKLEREAIARADLLLYPTRWVAESAVRDYGADPGKIRILPYGANLTIPPTREEALADRMPGPVRLLFVGVNWFRKGGNIALAAHQTLRARGIDSRLTVIGCIPPEGTDLSGVTVVPFLDKSDPAQLRQLASHYLSSDLFLLPTRSECYGIVFCEASAYGVPSITTATGGVPDVVTEGVNGFCLLPEADGTDYADKIEAVLSNRSAFQALRISSRDAYEINLNWQSWGGRVIAELHQLLEPH